MLTRIAPMFLLLVSAYAACDNQCSGHGTCMMDDVCKCYDNWGVGLSHDSGDCSERTCPFELAWVDLPDRSGTFHKYTECSGRGICGRDTGECACFDGYEGKACQRAACPNDCSGHGTCEYIQDMKYAATWNDYASIGMFDQPKTFGLKQWDAFKSRGCVCDATYGDVDCSKRMCPYGTDILDSRDNLLVSQKYQVQNLVFYPSRVTSFTDYAKSKKTFSLTFVSRLNETFTTIPIVFDFNDIADLVNDIQIALLNLPNRVIDGLTVAGNKDAGNFYFWVNITFTGPAVQGPQHLLVVNDYECNDGCTPKQSGLDLYSNVLSAGTTTPQPSMAFVAGTSSYIDEIRLADYNSYECGRRGKCDYATGLCACFTGYTGDNCNTLTTLV